MLAIRRLAIVSALLFAVAFVISSASGKSVVGNGTVALATPPLPTAKAPAKHEIGEHLMIEWGGSWWAASTLAAIDDGRVVIHYTGWGEEWDEIVKPTRIRREVQGTSNFAAGDSAFVEWKGSWWPAKVQKISTVGGKEQYAIRYDGYGKEWDETVGAARIKRLGPTEQ